MILIFTASVIAGIVLGAPVGVAGALVADAALAHNRKRLELTILAAVLGDTLVAFVTSFAAKTIGTYVDQHQNLFHIGGGLTILCLAGAMVVTTARAKHGVMHKEEIHGSSKWLVGHTAPALAAFLITALHPVSIGSFIATIIVFSTKYQNFHQYKLVFVGGIFIGSAFIFSLSGYLFWKIRQKADRFVHFLRYGLAGIVALLGVYLIAKQVLS